MLEMSVFSGPYEEALSRRVDKTTLVEFAIDVCPRPLREDGEIDFNALMVAIVEEVRTLLQDVDIDLGGERDGE